MHYGPHLQTLLAGRFVYDRKRGHEGDLDFPAGQNSANGGNSRMVLDFVCALEKRGFQADILLLNCGLHDIKRDTSEAPPAISAEEYEANLDALIPQWKRLARLPLWVSTTPLDEARHNSQAAFKRFESDNARYATLAGRVMAQHDITIVDLGDFTRRLLEARGLEAIFSDHVHFTDEARQLQAAFLAGALETAWALYGASQNR